MQKKHLFSIFLILSLFVFPFVGIGQYIWTQKQNFPGIERSYAVGFSINDKIFIGTGEDGSWNLLKDFWEYDSNLDTWTQIADLGGVARIESVGFSIGGKGYVGTGVDSSGAHLNDFWEYDPSNNMWTSKANFGGGVRTNAEGLAIGNKGYIVTGYTVIGSSVIYKNDFWEFDPLGNVWTPKTDFPGSGRMWAISFAIDNKGYIGAGVNGTFLGDWWAFDPVTNSWSQKANRVFQSFPSSFTLYDRGYVIASWNLNPFYEYNPQNNTWTSISYSPLYDTKNNAVGLATATKGYVITGSHSQHFLEYSINCSLSASFMVEDTVPKCFPVVFSNSSLNATSYIWKINGVPVSTATNFTYTFNSDGNYIIELRASNDTCLKSYSKTIVVLNQGEWIQKSSMQLSRAGAVGFSVNGKGYIGTGSYGMAGSYLNDFWEYNDTFNLWTQKANFGGLPRSGAIGFVINNKGYIGTGYDINNNFNDLWEWDSSNDSWIQKMDFPGQPRRGSLSFVYADKGYLGLGRNYSQPYYKNDIWEYSPVNNIWAYITLFPGSARENAVTFTFNNKVYIGIGNNSFDFFNDIWEYDIPINNWEIKTDFKGGGRNSAVAFPLGNNGYICTGYDGDSTKNDLWKFSLCESLNLDNDINICYKKFRIFPNPCLNGILNIEGEFSKQKKIILSLFDLNGTAVLSIVLPPSITVSSVHLPNLIAGTYIYNITYNSYVLQKGKLVIIN